MSADLAEEIRMRPNRRSTGFHVLTFAAAAILFASGCASSLDDGALGAGATRAATSATSRTSRSRPTPLAQAVSALDAPIAAILDDLGDEAKAYHAHVTTLSNPFFMGRAPGTRGIEIAAEYIEHYFRTFGLEPAFKNVIESADASEVLDPSYRQPFTVPGELTIDEAEFSWSAPDAGADLVAGTDWDPTPFTGSDTADENVVFVGYGVESGPDGYTSFEDDPDLTGKIALVLRFEPMDADGKSQWADGDGWSSNAGLIPKFRALTDRGAEGVILVNPPGAHDRRARELMSVRGSRFGGSGDIPVVMVTPEVADRMIAATGDERSLASLKAIADAGSHGAVALPGLAARTTIKVSRDEITTANVGAILPGRGALRNEYVVIGAHYDHLGMGAYGTRTPGKLHPGADDNASGTSGVLLAAEILADAYADLPEDADARSIMFLTFSAEEMGLLGSRHFVAEPPIALSQIVAMLNMDMIGRLRDHSIEVLGVGTGAQFESILTPHLKASPLDAKLSRLPGGRSDHASFSDEGVPSVAFFTGMHPDYHAPGDVGSKIHYKGAVEVVDLVVSVAMDLATRPDHVTFVAPKKTAQTAAPRMNISVRLGIAPANYADEDPGVAVGNVAEGTSAANAGMKKGDRIIRWNGEELLDIQDMMKQLAAAKPGDVARLVVLRDGEEVTLKVTLKARGGAN